MSHLSAGETRMAEQFGQSKKEGYVRWPWYAAIFAAYMLLTILITFPLAWFISDHLPMYPHIKGMYPGDGDPWMTVWYFPWIREHILHGSVTYDFQDIFFPTGVKFPFSLNFAYWISLAVILQSFMAPVTAYNVIILLSFPLSGIGTFLLIRHLHEDWKAAFLGGLIYAFYPYHLAQSLEHLNLANQQWIPFYILYLIRTVESGKNRDALAAGFFLFLNNITSVYYTLFLLLFTAFYMGWALMIQRVKITRRLLKNGAITLSLWAAASLPFMLPLLQARTNGQYLYLGVEEAAKFSADLLAWGLPSLLHPLWGERISHVYASFTGNVIEQTVFPGYGVWGLAILGSLAWRNRLGMFWTLAACLFLVLSLGPWLHVAGKERFGEYRLLLPFWLLHHLPGFNGLRTPSRLAAIALMCITVQATKGFQEIYRRGVLKRHLAMALGAMLVFEYLAVPLPLQKAEASTFHYRMREEVKRNGPFTIVEVPLDDRIVKYSFYQMVHKARRIGGHLGRPHPFYIDIWRNVPLFRDLKDPGALVRRPLNAGDAEAANDLLEFYKVRYVLLHKEFLSPADLQKLRQKLPLTAPVEEVFEDERLVAYRVNPIKKNHPDRYRAYFLNGWSDREQAPDGISFHWSSAGQSLTAIRMPEGQRPVLFLRMMPIQYEGMPVQEVTLVMDGRLLIRQTLHWGWADYRIPIPPDLARPGMHAVLFRYDHTAVPNQWTKGKNPDRRELAVAVSDIRVEVEQGSQSSRNRGRSISSSRELRAEDSRDEHL